MLSSFFYYDSSAQMIPGYVPGMKVKRINLGVLKGKVVETRRNRGAPTSTPAPPETVFKVKVNCMGTGKKMFTLKETADQDPLNVEMLELPSVATCGGKLPVVLTDKEGYELALDALLKDIAVDGNVVYVTASFPRRANDNNYYNIINIDNNAEL